MKRMSLLMSLAAIAAIYPYTGAFCREDGKKDTDNAFLVATFERGNKMSGGIGSAETRGGGWHIKAKGGSDIVTLHYFRGAVVYDDQTPKFAFTLGAHVTFGANKAERVIVGYHFRDFGSPRPFIGISWSLLSK